MNLLFAIGWIIYTIVLGTFSCGIGCLFGIIPVINIIACVMDFIAYNKLNSQNHTGTYSSVQFAAIFDIVTIITGNAASMIFGIIGLVYLNNGELKNYMVQKGIY
ncbi:MAG: hypothetical protein L0Y79_06325 [Chlorobi bacterium]|nr:hypothetical protein [Chlorobiota bacterium]